MKRGGIPRQLAIETLATLKEVLFPDDPDSQSILRSLVSKKGFDPDIIRIVESPLYREETSRPMVYQYWGTRLMDLYEELEDPTPRGIIWQWLERKSGARHASTCSDLMCLFHYRQVCLCVIHKF